MIKGCKICGISDPNTLNFLINHPHPPIFIGFICNYPKSSRYVEYENLKKLLRISPKQSYYVAVLVKPNINILEKINEDLGVTDLTSGSLIIDQRGLVTEPGKTISGKIKV